LDPFLISFSKRSLNKIIVVSFTIELHGLITRIISALIWQMFDLNIPIEAMENDKVIQELQRLQIKAAATIEFNKKLDVSNAFAKVPDSAGLNKSIYKRVNFEYQQKDAILKFVKQSSCDLVSISVDNEKELEAACELPVDIITIPRLFLKRNVVSKAKQNGIMLELLYSRGFTIQGRKDLIAMGNDLRRLNADFIISSGIRDHLDIRSRLDVLNMCHLFHMRDIEAIKLIEENCQKALLKGKGRSTFKGMFKLEENNEGSKKREAQPDNLADSSSKAKKPKKTANK
jgi:RNase P/RNase MRP subunit p30